MICVCEVAAQLWFLWTVQKVMQGRTVVHQFEDGSVFVKEVEDAGGEAKQMHEKIKVVQ